jgi:hypothetical protein
MRNVVINIFVIIYILSLFGCEKKNIYSISFPFSNEIMNKFDFRIEDKNTNNEIILLNNDIRKISFDINAFGRPEVNIVFSGKGERKFNKLITNNERKQMNIFFDNALFVSPIIEGPIKNKAVMNLGIKEVQFLISKNIFSSTDLEIIEVYIEIWKNSWETSFDE